MPEREEEYAAARRQPKGQPLCPYCGRPKQWSCADERCRMYRGTFPAPSYGPGE